MDKKTLTKNELLKMLLEIDCELQKLEMSLEKSINEIKTSLFDKHNFKLETCIDGIELLEDVAGDYYYEKTSLIS